MKCSTKDCPFSVKTFCKKCKVIQNLCSAHTGEHLINYPGHYPVIYDIREINQMILGGIKLEIKKYKSIVIKESESIIKSLQDTVKRVLKQLKQAKKNMNDAFRINKDIVNTYVVNDMISNSKYIFDIFKGINYLDNKRNINPVGVRLDLNKNLKEFETRFSLKLKSEYKKCVEEITETNDRRYFYICEVS